MTEKTSDADATADADDFYPDAFEVLTQEDGARIGTAFTTRDGSIDVYLNAYPSSGRLSLHKLTPAEFAETYEFDPSNLPF